jgi:hypothetical protein
MNTYDRKWQQLAAVARTAPDGQDESVPYGFSTRVATLAMAAPAAGPSALFEKFAVRGLIAACAFSLAAVAFGYSAWTGERENDVASDDAVTEVLDLS